MTQWVPRPLGHLAYRAAYVALRLWSLAARPDTRGVKCLLCAEDALLLVRHSYGPRVWDLPGGFVRRDESFEQAARRELGEELGIPEDVGRYGKLGEIERTVYGRHEIVGVFRVDLPEPIGAVQGFELVRIGWFERGALPAGRADLVEEILERDTRFA